MRSWTRRQALIGSAAGLAALRLPVVNLRLDADEKPPATTEKYRLGACDWSLGKRSDVAAFDVARQIGLDGVEVSFGEPGGTNDLREPAVRRRYKAASQEAGVQIASLAMGILNQIPYASDPRTEQWVADVVEVMPKVGVTCCLLAFFGDGDINGDRTKQAEVIRRLKRVAPLAEKARVVLGVESWMNAADHMRILDAVGSPALKVYCDVANMTKQGYDVGREIRQLGADRICQLHMKENGALLGKGQVNFDAVKAAVEEIDYRGWLILEGATERGKSLLECYQENRRFLRSLFAIS